MGSVDNDDLDWKPTIEDTIDEKVYRDLRPFILLVERFRLSAEQSSMLWNATLLCNGNTEKKKFNLSFYYFAFANSLW